MTVVLGQDAKLPCFYRGGPDEQVEQVSWARVDAGEGARELALLNSKYGLHVGTTYEGRVERPPPPRSPLDGAVLLRHAVQADEGEYECRVSTFPAGSFQARLRLRVLGKQGPRRGWGDRRGWPSHRGGPHAARAALRSRSALPASAAPACWELLPFVHRRLLLGFSCPSGPRGPGLFSLSCPPPSAPRNSQHPSPGHAHLGPSPGVPFQVSLHPHSCPAHAQGLTHDPGPW